MPEFFEKAAAKLQERYKPFAIDCHHCGSENRLDIDDVSGLHDHISDQEDAAREEGRDEVRDEYANPELVEADLLIADARPLHELAIAIEAGSRNDQRHWLDRIAASLGDAATEQVQQGRYSPRARP